MTCLMFECNPNVLREACGAQSLGDDAEASEEEGSTDDEDCDNRCLKIHIISHGQSPAS